MVMTAHVAARPQAPRERSANRRHDVIVAVALAVFVIFNFQVPIATSGAVGLMRWVLLGVLALEGLAIAWSLGGEMPFPKPLLGLALFSFVTFASVVYSDVPLLSLYKAISFALALLALVVGNGLRARAADWLRLLVWANATIAATTIAMLVTGLGSATDAGLLRGPFGNANSLGSVIALTLPAVLWAWQSSRERGRVPRAWALLGLAVTDLVLVYASRSRASIAALVLALLLHSLFRSRRLAAAGLFGLLVLVLASPGLASQIQSNALYKGVDPRSSFQDRIQEFHTSLAAAESRPLEGHGFGVSVGFAAEWNGSLSLIDAAREKSNSFLGIVEEVGLIGAIPLALSLLAVMGRSLWIAWTERRRHDAGTLFALASVFVVGLLHSNSEAWLTSAGSFEGFIFWGTVGLLLFALSAPRPRPTPIPR